MVLMYGGSDFAGEGDILSSGKIKDQRLCLLSATFITQKSEGKEECVSCPQSLVHCTHHMDEVVKFD